MSGNRRLSEWNEVLAEGEALLADMRRRAIRMRDGWHRRAVLRLADWLRSWIERGRRWRDADLRDD